MRKRNPFQADDSFYRIILTLVEKFKIIRIIFVILPLGAKILRRDVPRSRSDPFPPIRWRIHAKRLIGWKGSGRRDFGWDYLNPKKGG
jgi:hypothetical protein